MPPALRLCSCLCLCLILLATCSAIPTWHHRQGMVVLKDSGLLPPPPIRQGYNEAQIAAAQAIRDAGEDAQLHLAFLKKKYMDIVRQHFYNAFAPLPFIKERLNVPNIHQENVLAIKNPPLQPLYIDQAAGYNPCSENILNCLQGNIPPRLGKIVPPSSAGHQPCFGPNCNHVFFSPNFKPVVIPKPTHNSHSINKKPSKRPHKHHRICDRKRPDQNCHHQSTFWPTYATLKFSTKVPVTTTNPPKEVNLQDRFPSLQTMTGDRLMTKLQQHTTLPGTFFNKVHPMTVIPKTDEKLDFETLRTNTTKLENEILGIPEEIIKDVIKGYVTPTTKTQLSLEADKGVLTEPVSSTPLLSANVNISKTISENNIELASTELSLEVKDDSQTISPLKTFVDTENVPKATESTLLQSTMFSELKELNEIKTTAINGGDYATRPTEAKNAGSKMGVESQEYSFTTSEDMELEYNPTTATPISPSHKIPLEESDQFLYTMANNEEDVTRMFDNDLTETTSAEILHQPTFRSIFENTQMQREFTQTVVEDLRQSTQEYSIDLRREDTNEGTVDSETTTLNSAIETRTNAEESTTPIIFLNTSENYNYIKEDTASSVSDFSEKVVENLSTTVSSVTSDTSKITSTKDNQMAREDTFTDSSVTDPNKTVNENEFQRSSSEINNIKILPTEIPHSTKSAFDEITTEDSTNNVELTSEVANLKSYEISTEENNSNRIYLIAREDVFELTTNYEHPSEMKMDKLDSWNTIEVPTSSDASTRVQTDSSYLDEESKINLEEENNLFSSTTKNIEEWTTEKLDSTEHSPLPREEMFQETDYPHKNTLDQLYSASREPLFIKPSTQINKEIVQGETTAKSIEVTTILSSTITETPYLTENKQFSAFNSGSDTPKLAEEIENLGTSTNYINEREGITTESGFVELPQLREDGNELYETPELLQSTSEITMATNGKLIDILEERTTLVSLSDTISENTQDNVASKLTEVPDLSENIPDDFSLFVTATEKYPENIATKYELVTETKRNNSPELEEKSFESNLINPEELFGQTDTPGLLISEDWTETQTEDMSINIFTAFTNPTTSVSTEYPHLKTEEEDSISAANHSSHISAKTVTDIGVTETTKLTNLKYDELTQIVDPTAITNYETFSSENNYGKDTEVTGENPSLDSYQNGVLEIKTEIETRTGDVQNTVVTEESTNPGLDLELNYGFNRKARSVQHSKDEVKSYPTTECILCVLGLSHGHRIKRSEINSHNNVSDNNKPSNLTKVLQSEKSREPNCSSSANLQDSEYSNLYASTILELLPVIREGYRHNAFSEDDKKVIRSLFGDMKALMEEHTFERITESSSDLLMGDGTSRFDEIVEDTDYDSSEGNIGMSEKEIRLKRSKKNVQIMNDLLKKIPNSLRSHVKAPTQLKSSRMVRSTQVSQAEASAILALLSEKGEAVQLDIPDDEDDDEYEYYEDEGDDFGIEDSEYADVYEDDYDRPSFGELIKLARKHRERKARAEKS